MYKRQVQPAQAVFTPIFISWSDPALAVKAFGSQKQRIGTHWDTPQRNIAQPIQCYRVSHLHFIIQLVLIPRQSTKSPIMLRSLENRHLDIHRRNPQPRLEALKQ